MYYYPFHDLSVSALGIGSLRLPARPEDPNCIDREKAQKVIDYALGHGINFVDTAYTYHEGDSERFLGEALKKHNRSSYYLSSKYYVSANPDIRALFEEQLRRLQTDYLDFYLLHGMDENSFDAFYVLVVYPDRAPDNTPSAMTCRSWQWHSSWAGSR